MLCAPSLGGESFGMVLTEAFAAGTPVVASDIAGYRDVVTRRRRRRARPARRRDRAGRGAARPRAGPRRAATRSPPPRARSAQRYAWPRVAAEVLDAYEDAIAMPAPAGLARARCALGFAPADGVRVPARAAADARAAAGGRGRRAAAGGAARCAAPAIGVAGAARRGARGLRAAAHRRRADRRVAARRDADVGAASGSG